MTACIERSFRAAGSQWIRANRQLTAVSYGKSLKALVFPRLHSTATRRICYRSVVQLPSSHAARIRFDAFEADLRTQELRREGRTLRLPNQSFIVLSMLLERPGELVTREELRQRLWPKERFVDTEQSLNAAVNRLREALKDSADAPTYIETLPRRGYRFIGSIEPPAPPASPTSLIAPHSTDAADTPLASKRPLPASALIALACAALVGGALWFWAAQPAKDTEPGKSTRLYPFTSLLQQEVAPAFAPDGRHIAFAWNGESREGFDLYVKQDGAEQPLRLTRRPSEWISAAWSPDGRTIAFARESPDGSGIYAVPAPLGGTERRLATASFAPSPLTQLSWTPDGKRLVYAAFSAAGVLALYELDVGAVASRALDVAADCWDLGSPAVSPDGGQIAFVCTSSYGVYTINTVALNGGAVRMLTRVMGFPKGLTWSLDDSHVIFANDAGDGGGLWQVSLDGKVTRLPLGEEASMPTVEPKRGRIAYARGRERIDIWRIDLHSTAPEREARRLISSTRVQMNPQFSPDGSRIAFQSTRSGSAEVWIAEADGANPTRITSFEGPLAGAPTWCRDGRRIAFDSRASGVSALYIADIEERQARQVDTSVPNLALPVWSEDCEWLIASDGNEALYIVPAGGGDARRFTNQSSYYAGVAGSEVIFNAKARNGVSLWRKRIDGEAEHALEGMPVLSYNDCWLVASDGIYFTLAAEDARTVRFYDFASRAIRPIAQLPSAPAPAGGLGLTISADRRWLLYAQREDEQSDIVILAQD